MSDTYKPETITELLNKAEKVLVDAHNSGYIIGVNQGVEVERERIIKLLEEHKKTYLAEEVMYCCEGGNNYWFQHAIALIKGEK